LEEVAHHVDHEGRVRIHAWKHYNVNTLAPERPDWTYDDQNSLDPRKLGRYDDSLQEMLGTAPETPILDHVFIKALREKTLEQKEWYKQLVSRFSEPVSSLPV